MGDQQMTDNAQKIVDEDSNVLSEEQAQKLENYQRLHWDVLYKNNKTNLYKDRHYIKYEFVDLVDAVTDGKGAQDDQNFSSNQDDVDDDDEAAQATKR